MCLWLCLPCHDLKTKQGRLNGEALLCVCFSYVLSVGQVLCSVLIVLLYVM